MKIMFFLILVTLISCGKKDSDSSFHVENTERDRENLPSTPSTTDSITPVENCVDEVCYTEIVNESPIEINETTIESNVEITEDQIVVAENPTEDINVNVENSPSECEVDMNLGDEYSYEIKKDKLFLEMNKRKFIFRKISDQQTDLNGTWIWRGNEEGKSILLTLTILENNKIVIRKTCES